MTPPRHITIQPIYQHVAETQRTLLMVVIFIGGILLSAAVAYQAVQLDRQIAAAERI
jgi:uncharacterized membrane protein YidH (DUF202 family)